MLKNSIIAISLLFFAFLDPQGLKAQDPLAWMEAVAPPFFIHDGDLKGQGYEDVITEILIANLPQYHHTHMKANISRHYQQWKQGEKACSVGMYKTPERLEFAYYSIPSVFTLPPVLIIHKNRYEAFGGQKMVNLAKILQKNTLVIGRSPNRSYGMAFDSSLKTYSNSKNTFSYESPELSLNLFKMLLAGRIDALPGLPEEAMYLAETMGIRDEIMTLSVEENQANPEASLSYVACSKNAWGETVIKSINQVLLAQRPTEIYRAAYERWLDPSSIEGYRKLYEEVFLSLTE
ncbi:MAG: TIGR02285 family protein [Desulforhopalus sp.]|nr:TIGR02285 family protein [Desulforhopalus sp.]